MRESFVTWIKEENARWSTERSERRKKNEQNSEHANFKLCARFEIIKLLPLFVRETQYSYYNNFFLYIYVALWEFEAISRVSGPLSFSHFMGQSPPHIILDNTILNMKREKKSSQA